MIYIDKDREAGALMSIEVVSRGIEGIGGHCNIDMHREAGALWGHCGTLEGIGDHRRAF